MKTIHQDSTLGDIVTAYPLTASLFQSLKIDFCCGGERTLRAALKDQDLSLSAVWPSIQDLIEKNELLKRTDPAEFNPADLDPSELIDWIEEHHHVWLRSHLPDIAALLFKILSVHGVNHPELFTVHRLFSQLKAELEQHLVKEEVWLFPNPANQTALIDELRAEHEKAGALLRDLRRETFDYSVPEDGCSTYALAVQSLAELETDLFRHIHLENNQLFQRLTAQNPNSDNRR